VPAGSWHGSRKILETPMLAAVIVTCPGAVTGRTKLPKGISYRTSDCFRSDSASRAPCPSLELGAIAAHSAKRTLAVAFWPLFKCFLPANKAMVASTGLPSPARAQNLIALAESYERNNPSHSSLNDVACVGIDPHATARKGPVLPPNAAM